MTTKTLFSIMVALCLVAGCASSKKAAEHPLAGMWDYSIDSPEGQYKGTINVTDSEGTLMGSLTSDAISGQMDLTDIVFMDNTFSFSFDSGQYGVIDVKVDVAEAAFNGFITVEGVGQMPITGSKKMSGDM